MNKLRVNLSLIFPLLFINCLAVDELSLEEMKDKIERRAEEFANERANPVNNQTLFLWELAFKACAFNKLKQDLNRFDEVLNMGKRNEEPTSTEVNDKCIIRMFYSNEEKILPYFQKASNLDNVHQLTQQMEKDWKEISAAYTSKS